MTTRPAASAHFQLFALSAPTPVRWRLLSGNNRELGRAVADYADAGSCLVALEELLAGLADLELSIRRTTRQLWVWELRRDDVPVARGARPFDRQIRCSQAADQFVRVAVDAPVSADVMVSAARRWVTSAGSNRTVAPLLRHVL